MAVGKDTFPTMHSIAGFRLGTGSAGIKKPGKKDLVIMAFDDTATVAATFTKNAFCAAPVKLAKAHLQSSSPLYLVTNTGNANAGTGQQGMTDAEQVCRALASLGNCAVEQVLPFSTGVIGEPLPVDKIINALAATLNACAENGWADAGLGIMTTDTRPKGASKLFDIGGKTVTITGISKGAGMIKPNMATMLAFIFTDASIEQHVLQSLLKSATDRSFNAITVDSDTSTSDTVLTFATGRENPVSDINDPILDDFKEKFADLMIDLAHQIVRDGEGAQKFVEINVTGAESDLSAKKIALCIANSPLVKTAIAGEDANWGRIVMAVGKAGEKADRDNLVIHIGGQKVTEHGMGVDGYNEGLCTDHLKGTEIKIDVDVGIADGNSTVWTCDLTHDYITINADYRS